MTPAQLALRIAAGEAEDAEFDGQLPEAARQLSRQFWTPVAVAYRVTEWLEASGAASLLDVGAGVGKLCAVVALRSARPGGRALQVAGIEQRASLVAVASQIARDLGASATYITARISDTQYAAGGDSGEPAIHLGPADAYYLYNPFGENLSGDAPTAGDPSRAPDHIDDEFPRDEAAFLAGVRATERLLKQARPGTQLITFNGYGGVIPSSYDARAVERYGLSDLIWWTKR